MVDEPTNVQFFEKFHELQTRSTKLLLLSTFFGGLSIGFFVSGAIEGSLVLIFIGLFPLAAQICVLHLMRRNAQRLNLLGSYIKQKLDEGGIE